MIYSLETAGIKCFPDFHTVWHFDDKVGQKYLLESIGAPLVPSYVFYSKKDALEWVEHTDFPKVFKLRGGAGSSNVILAHTPQEARSLIKKSFGKGFPQNSIRTLLSEYKRFKKEGKSSLVLLSKALRPIILNQAHITRFIKTNVDMCIFRILSATTNTTSVSLLSVTRLFI